MFRRGKHQDSQENKTSNWFPEGPEPELKSVLLYFWTFTSTASKEYPERIKTVVSVFL